VNSRADPSADPAPRRQAILAGCNLPSPSLPRQLLQPAQIVAGIGLESFQPGSVCLELGVVER